MKEKNNGNDCLVSEYDNMFYDKPKITFARSEVIHFYKNFSTLKEARCISDHPPISFEFSLN
jgi:deoxyribonuclease-1-like protein